MKKSIKVPAKILAGVGALNWGLAKVFSFNLVDQIAGSGIVSTVIYGAVGIAGGVVLYGLVKGE